MARATALAVEGGQIFEGTASAGEHNEVDEIGSVELGQCGFDLAGADSPCTETGQTRRSIRVAAANDVEEIADHRAGGRSDNAHSVRKQGQSCLRSASKRPSP